MDEPLTGLDTPAQEGLLALLAEMQKKQVTIMVATHDLEQAGRTFDRILLLNHKMIAFGSAAEVLKPENLLEAYGGRMKVVHGKSNLAVIDETCCEDGEPHDHAR
jgi:ABC-type Mn2+/Zn2+ transport system ATPase subunit